MSIWVIFKLLGSLALLMFGMKSMSEALQKMAGPALRHALGAMFHWFTYRYYCYSLRAVIDGNDGDDRLVCQCRTADTGTGHLGDYGCQYRYDADGLDYGPWYVDRYQ